MRDKILDYICKKNTLQRKKLSALFQKNTILAAKLESFLNTYSLFMQKHGIDYKRLCDAYLSVVDQMSHARIHFLKTNQYPAKSQAVSVSNIYENEELMTSYMLGLALSQFLWKHHFEVFMFYAGLVNKMKEKSYFMEIGSGHGLFLIELLKNIRKNSRIDIIDVSPISLKITRGLVEALTPSFLDNISFIQSDITSYSGTHLYDFITMGEVLEHVEDPLKLLCAVYRLLGKNGFLFISTCADCPAIDHVYHFKTIDEIKSLISEAKFQIKEEIVALSEEIDKEKQKRFKPDIMYAALLAKE